MSKKSDILDNIQRFAKSRFRPKIRLDELKSRDFGAASQLKISQTQAQDALHIQHEISQVVPLFAVGCGPQVLCFAGARVPARFLTVNLQLPNSRF